MALTNAEPRLAPLREVWDWEVHGTFQVWGLQPRDRRRSHSHAGYTPHHLISVSHGGGLEQPGARSRRGSGRRPASGGEAEARAPGAGLARSAGPPSGRPASELPCAACGPQSCSEGSLELWPDTDSEDEACYEWSPCSRPGRGAVPARAAALQPPPPQVLATTPACSGAAAHPPAAPPAPLLPPAAAGPPRGRAGAPAAPAAPPPAGQPQAPAQPPVPRPPGPPALERSAAGPCPAHGRGGPLGRAAAVAPPGAGRGGGLSGAMRAAESALAALEAAEAAAGGAAAAAACTGEARGRAGGKLRELPAGVTSLMLRNLPREITQRRLLHDIGRSGFAPDFCYMPRDFASGETRGHAFLNFPSCTAAVEFARAWHGRPCCAGRAAAGPDGIDVSVATLQGLAAHAAKWDCPRMKRVRNPDFKPFILEGGAIGRHA